MGPKSLPAALSGGTRIGCTVTRTMGASERLVSSAPASPLLVPEGPYRMKMPVNSTFALSFSGAGGSGRTGSGRGGSGRGFGAGGSGRRGLGGSGFSLSALGGPQPSASARSPLGSAMTRSYSRRVTRLEISLPSASSTVIFGLLCSHWAMSTPARMPAAQRQRITMIGVADRLGGRQRCLAGGVSAASPDSPVLLSVAVDSGAVGTSSGRASAGGSCGRCAGGGAWPSRSRARAPRASSAGSGLSGSPAGGSGVGGGTGLASAARVRASNGDGSCVEAANTVPQCLHFSRALWTSLASRSSRWHWGQVTSGTGATPASEVLDIRIIPPQASGWQELPWGGQADRV